VKGMNMITTAMVGTLESSDIQVTIEPKNEKGIEIVLKSSVEKQFGTQIRKVIKETLEALNVENAVVTAVDKGALDCTIKARVQCAAYRAAGIKDHYNWEV
jgi:citrate lyase subunit gamma (acyl carrier protein)